MTNEERLDRINRLLAGLGGVWHLIAAELQTREQGLIADLISQDDEQKRGAIKELRTLLNLPETLHQERESIAAALSEQSDAAP